MKYNQCPWKFSGWLNYSWNNIPRKDLPRVWLTENILENPKFKPPAIIYVQTIAETHSVCNTLKQAIAQNNDSNINEWKVAFYHGEINTLERKKTQNDFLQNQIQILVTTNAFGLGVNHSDIRTVVHLGLPLSISAYYQETGRAGRNIDKEIQCYCLCYFTQYCTWSAGNLVKHCSDKDRKLILRKLNGLYQAMRFMHKHPNLVLDQAGKYFGWTFINIFSFLSKYTVDGDIAGTWNFILQCDGRDLYSDLKFYVELLLYLGCLYADEEDAYYVYIPKNFSDIIKEKYSMLENGEINDQIFYWFVNEFFCLEKEVAIITVREIEKQYKIYFEKLMMEMEEKESKKYLSLATIEDCFVRLFHDNIGFDFQKDKRKYEYKFNLANEKSVEIDEKMMEQIVLWLEDLQNPSKQWLSLFKHVDSGDMGNDSINHMFEKHFQREILIDHNGMLSTFNI